MSWRPLPLLLLLLGPLSGCVDPEADTAATTSLTAGANASYALTAPEAKGHVRLAFGQPYAWSEWDGDRAPAVDVTIEVENPPESKVATFSLVTGDLLRLSGWSSSGRGSEQYYSRSHEWKGHPALPADAFRCIAGVLVPLWLKTSLDPSAEEVALGPFAGWHRENGTIDPPGGRASIQATHGPWPNRLSWERTDGASCTLTLLKASEGAGALPWGSGQTSEASDARRPLQGRAPPTGTLPVSFDVSLDEAVATAERDPSLALFLRGHPAAWVVHAEYQRADERTLWVLLFADPSTGESHLARVERSPAGVVVVSSAPFETRPFTLPRSALSDGVVTAADAFDARDGFPTIPATGDLVLTWSTASTSLEAATADAARWQIQWSVPAGTTSYLASAVDGEAMAHVVLPTFRPTSAPMNLPDPSP